MSHYVLIHRAEGLFGVVKFQTSFAANAWADRMNNLSEELDGFDYYVEILDEMTREQVEEVIRDALRSADIPS